MRRSLLSHPAAALTVSRLSLLCALFLLLAPTAGADVVTGRVVGSDNNEPLAEARMKVFVIPINENYVSLDEMTADSTGRFAIHAERISKIQIDFSYFGYKTVRKHYNAAGGNDTIDVGDIVLPLSDVLLKEAVVKARARRFTMHGDTIIFNPEAFHLEQGERMSALITQLPGVSIKKGKIFFMEKEVQLKMNGRDMTDSELTALLPAEAVQHIKAYQQKSQVAELSGMDDGQESQVLDIIIKPGFMDKWYGRTKVGAYASKNYRASANLHYLTDSDPFNVYALASDCESQTYGVSGESEMDYSSLVPKRQQYGRASYKHSWIPKGVTTSYKEDYWDVNFSPEHHDDRQNIRTDTENFTGGPLSVFQTDHSYYYSHGTDLPVGAGLTVHFNPRTWLRVGASGKVGSEDARTRSEAEQFEGTSLDDADRIAVNATTSKQERHSDRRNADASMEFKHVFDGGDIAISLNPKWSREEEHAERHTAYDYFDLGTHVDETRTSQTENTAHSIKAQAAVRYEIVPKRLKTGAGYRTAYSRNSSHSMAGRDGMTDDANSYDRRTRQMSHQPYVSLETDLGPVYLSMDMEMHNSDERLDYRRGRLDTAITRNTWFPRPRMDARWKISKFNELKASASWGYELTDLLESSNYTDDTNPMHIRRGNPALHSARLFFTSATYSLMMPRHQQMLTTYVAYSRTSRPTTEARIYNATTGAYTYTKVNVNTRHSVQGRISYDRDLGGGFNLRARTEGKTTRGWGISTATSPDEPRQMFRQTDSYIYQEINVGTSTAHIEARAIALGQYQRVSYSDPSMANLNMWDYTAELLGKYKTTHWTYYVIASFIGHEGYVSPYYNRLRVGLDAGITWNTLGGKGQLELKAEDIFNQMANIVSHMTPTSRFNYQAETLHRYLRLTFTYNFDAKARKGTH